MVLDLGLYPLGPLFKLIFPEGAASPVQSSIAEFLNTTTDKFDLILADPHYTCHIEAIVKRTGFRIIISR